MFSRFDTTQNRDEWKDTQDGHFATA